jgi:hypothetical protein
MTAAAACRPKARVAAGFVFLAALVSGCSLVAPQTYALKETLKENSLAIPQRTELTEVPFFPQIDYYCGPSSLAMVLSAAGARATPDTLVDQVFLPGRKGSLQVEMLAAARRNGMVAYERGRDPGDRARELRPFPLVSGLALLSCRRLRPAGARGDSPLRHTRSRHHAAAHIRKNLERRTVLGDGRDSTRPGAGDRQ